jgi:hypothetical protein
MKFRITPLNFVTTAFLILAVYMWKNGASIAGVQYQQLHLGHTLSWIFLLFAFVIFVLDLMFRNFFPETKKLWIVEISFIALATIIFLLVRK